MELFWHRKGLGIPVLIALVANLLILTIFNLPRERWLRKLENKAAALGLRIEKGKEELVQAKEREKNFKELHYQVESFYSEILRRKEEGMVDVLAEVEELAKRFQVKKESIQYHNEIIDEDKVILFEITFPLRGSYANLRRFINRIENSKYFLIIDRVELSNPEEKGDNLKLNIKLSTYFSLL